MNVVFITYLTLVVSVCLIGAHPLSQQQQQQSPSGESLDVPYAIAKRDLTAAESSLTPDGSTLTQMDTNDKFKYGDIVLNGLGGFGYAPGFGMGMPGAGYIPGAGFGTGMGTGAGMGNGLGGYMPNPYYPNIRGRYDNLGNGMGMGNFYERRYN